MGEPTTRRDGLSVAWLAGALLGWIAFDNVLLAAFLGYSLPLVLIAALMSTGGIAIMTARTAATAQSPRIGWSTIGICLVLAAVLLILGGEGRWLYANPDWQVRDAVLADMGRNPWPFAYQIDGMVTILRAPLGMYLKPALIGGDSHTARDMALLVSNAAALGGLLALGSALFNTTRSRIIALFVFIAFSGLDAIGTWWAMSSGTPVSLDHIELWVDRSQYSSHLTMLFWVPQHAIAGWLCAITFLLWRTGRLSLGVFAAAIPLAALWSPLAVMGAIPFAILAGVETLLKRSIRISDIMLAVGAVAISSLSLIFLKTDAEAVASHFTAMSLTQYAMVLTLEVLPLTAFALWHRRLIGYGNAVPVVVLLCLVLMPLYCIGTAIDFQMRASIMPLAILALSIATLFERLDTNHGVTRAALLALLLLGAITPLAEMRRAFVFLPAPASACTLPEAWDAQTGNIVSKSTYLARLDALPSWMRPSQPAQVDGQHRKACWHPHWATPRFDQ